MSAFVQPETLEGDNQYFCEQCNKKCDAHKVCCLLHEPAVSESNYFLVSAGVKVQEVPLFADVAVEKV